MVGRPKKIKRHLSEEECENLLLKAKARIKDRNRSRGAQEFWQMFAEAIEKLNRYDFATDPARVEERARYFARVKFERMNFIEIFRDIVKNNFDLDYQRERLWPFAEHLARVNGTDPEDEFFHWLAIKRKDLGYTDHRGSAGRAFVALGTEQHNKYLRRAELSRSRSGIYKYVDSASFREEFEDFMAMVRKDEKASWIVTACGANPGPEAGPKRPVPQG